MATTTKEIKAWTVLTPAGKIYCDYTNEAHEYKIIYGYVIFKTPIELNENTKHKL